MIVLVVLFICTAIGLVIWSNKTKASDITGEYVISLDEIIKDPQYTTMGINKIGTLETPLYKQELCYSHTDKDTGIEHYTLLYTTKDNVYRYNILRNPQENPNIIIIKEMTHENTHFTKWVRVK